jgi:hypothetical protein
VANAARTKARRRMLFFSEQQSAFSMWGFAFLDQRFNAKIHHVHTRTANVTRFTSLNFLSRLQYFPTFANSCGN